MERVISHLVKQFEDGRVTRRQLIQGLAAAALAASGDATAQAQDGGFRTLNFDHASYDVTDYRRTRDFYSGLLGMAVVNDNGTDACELHFGDLRGVGVRDQQMISIQTRPVAKVDHFAFKIDNWDTDRVRAELERRGLKPRLARGGAIDTPNYVSLTVQDPDGLGVQVSGIARPGDSAYPPR
jgi:catechol 2,3-dioxygenase-like lactoylglutathione lyase family enzyme